jgi:cobalt/nickel transport protein
MSNKLSGSRNLAFAIVGLGISLLIAIFLSPFASPDPDGLDRVSQDLQFGHRAAEDAPAKKLPFAQIFDEYALKGVPEGIATPIAGLVGTLVTFGLAWGIGKLVVKNSHSSPDEGISAYQSNDEQPN